MKNFVPIPQCVGSLYICRWSNAHRLVLQKASNPPPTCDYSKIFPCINSFYSYVKGFISKLLFTYSQKILIRYLNSKQNLRPEKGICCIIQSIQLSEFTGFLESFYESLLCSNVLLPWQHFEMSHTGIQPSDNIV